MNVSQRPALLFYSCGRIARKEMGHAGIRCRCAGGFGETPWKGLLKWCVKRSVLVGMETHARSKTFRDIRSRLIGSRVRDEVADAFSVKKTYQRRFVFIAHTKRSKGIFEALRAFELLGAEYTGFYGPIMGGVPKARDTSFLQGCSIQGRCQRS